MNLFSLSDLYDLYLKYADVESIISLKCTCKDLYHRIPESWCVNKITIAEDKYEKDYRFLSHLYSLYSTLETLHLDYKYFRSLREVYLIQVNKLSDIRFDPKTKEIQDIFINYAHALKRIDIPKEYTNLKLLYIAYTNISKLTISNTWTSLKNIVLIGLVHLSELIIPEECKNIEFINISKSCIEKVYFYPKCIRNIMVRTAISSIFLYTHTSNYTRIIKTDSVILKSLK